MVRLVGDEFKTATAQIGVSVYCPRTEMTAYLPICLSSDSAERT